ncbi:hypothetical protein [Rhizobium sp. RU36D]|uniref:hypothetical protein n=1 Tax=Rhizobium sp. RU36D TaxID=1907415 RepID=UPI00117A1A1C|nr:hypothetical protein [Rhizobium sp. RU36D]
MVIVLFCAASAEEAKRDSYDEAEMERVSSLVASGQCEAAWKVLWGHVVDGSAIAGGQLVAGLPYIDLTPPMALPKTEDVDEWRNDPAARELMYFLTDVAFAIDGRNISRYFQDIRQLRHDFLRERWGADAIGRYEAAGCFGPQAADSCWDAAKWFPEIRSLRDWDAELSKNAENGIVSKCVEPMHAYRDKMNDDDLSGSEGATDR